VYATVVLDCYVLLGLLLLNKLTTLKVENVERVVEDVGQVKRCNDWNGCIFFLNIQKVIELTTEYFHCLWCVETPTES
jgi:hypothetical protein